MTSLPETQEAFYELRANTFFGSGRHANNDVVLSGSYGRLLADIPFDASRHSPREISLISPIGIALGEDYVRRVEPFRPILPNIVLDCMSKHELEAVEEGKEGIAYELTESLEEALPHHKDRLRLFVIGDIPEETAIAQQAQVLTTEDDLDIIQHEIADLCASGPTFVISDFERIQFGETFQGKVDSLVAVKVNHILERAIPAGIGFISLGGWLEVNTNKPKQLSRVNAELEEHHKEVVGALEAAGASVASIIVEPKFTNNYDQVTADEALSQAVQQLNHKHQ